MNYDPGRLEHAGSQVTDLSCRCLFPLFIAVCDHKRPILQTDVKQKEVGSHFL